MPVAFAIRDVDVEEDTGFVYCDVDFYASILAKTRDEEPIATEDFRMQLARMVTRIVTNEDGWMREPGGEFEYPYEQDPDTGEWQPKDREWETETVEKTGLELLQEVRDNIRRHADTLEVTPALRGDRRLRRKPRMRVDDPDGWRTRLASLREARSTRQAARLGR